MKKIMILGVSFCVAVALLIGYNNFGHVSKHVIDSAKLPYFNNANDVINNSELIVEVSKIGEKPVSYDLGEGLYDNLTLSKVKIEKVIKPLKGKKLDVGDEIWIVESEWTDKETGVIHHTENYSKMTDNKKYRLYLGYNSEVDNYYPVGLLYGKVPMNTMEKNYYGDFKNDHIKGVVEELQKNP
jgi:hypothetical protein